MSADPFGFAQDDNVILRANCTPTFRRYGLTVNEDSFEPAAPQPVVSVASTVPVETVWFALAGLYTKTTAVSGVVIFVAGISAVS